MADSKEPVPVIPARAAAPAAPPAPAADAPEEHPIAERYVALRSFTARHMGQLISFVEGQEIASHVGHWLHNHGGPVRPIE